MAWRTWRAWRAWAGREDQLALAAVAAAFLLLQLLTVTPRIFYSWDEALYLGQFAPGVPPVPMDAPRAWGIPLIVAPVTAVTGSVVAVRLYLASLSAAGLFLAYLPWVRLRRGGTAPLAAALFASLWLTIFYAGAAMPNVYVAEGAVYVVGTYCLMLRGGGTVAWRRVRAAGLVTGLGIVALIRPTDAVWIVLPLVLGGLVLRSRRCVLPIIALGAGFAVGWVPWTIEAYVRFGGLIQRLNEVNAINGTGFKLSADPALRNLQALSSGTPICFSQSPTCGSVSAGGILLWAALPVFVLAGLGVLRQQPAYRAMLLAAAVALSAGTPYLTIVRQVNPRYLLTSYALAALPAAVALCRLTVWRPRRARIAGVLLASTLVAAHMIGQVTTARSVAAQQFAFTDSIRRSAVRLARLGIRPPCVVAGNFRTDFSYALHCEPQVWDYDRMNGRAGGDCLPPELYGQDRRIAFIRRGRPQRAVRLGWSRVILAPGWYADLPPRTAAPGCGPAPAKR